MERAGADIQKTSAERERTKRLAYAKREKLGLDNSAPFYEKLHAEGTASKQRLVDLAKSLEAGGAYTTLGELTLLRHFLGYSTTFSA